MLLGLRIKGKVVNGQVNQYNAICEQLLGADLIDDTTRGQGINLKYLKQYYSNMVLTADATEEEKIMKTRCYIMILFGNFLFPETTGIMVNMMYLTLLRDLNKTRTYSWGSIVLSHLYSALCKCAHKDTCSFFFLCFFTTSMGLVENANAHPPQRERIQILLRDNVSLHKYLHLLYLYNV